MSNVRIDIEAELALSALNRFAQIGTHSLLEVLGALVEGQTKRRISSEKSSPDGVPWAPLAPLTVKARRKGSNSPLTDTGRLLGSISHTVAGNTAVVGTNVFYAPYHQYGVEGIKPKKGKKLRVPLAGGGAAFIGGSSIPARPFMGVSDANMAEIRAAVDAWVTGAFDG
jgi:phage gpG-like protein